MVVTNILFTALTLVSIFCGIKIGYVDSHTPPLPLLISGFLLIVGVPLLIFKKNFSENKINLRIHLLLMCVNLLIVLFCFSLIFI